MSFFTNLKISAKFLLFFTQIHGNIMGKTIDITPEFLLEPELPSVKERSVCRMATDYLPVYTTVKSLSEDMNSLVDKLGRKEVSVEEVRKWLTTWEKNCPNLIYSDEAHTEFLKTLSRYCGKRRLLVIKTILTQPVEPEAQEPGTAEK